MRTCFTSRYVDCGDRSSRQFFNGCYAVEITKLYIMLMQLFAYLDLMTINFFEIEYVYVLCIRICFNIFAIYLLPAIFL